MLKRLLLIAPVLAVTACAGLGLPAPDTFNKRIAAGYTLVQTLGDGATAAVKAGKLKPADATNVVTTGRAALDGLDLARSLHAGACPPLPSTGQPDPACVAPAADTKLTATLAVLSALQAYLATQGAK